MNTDKSKWKALMRLIIFTILFIIIFLGLENKLYDKRYEHPMWSYVTDSNSKPIDVLFVGNSHIYTSIDAEVISKATGVNVRALTCSSINGEIVKVDLEAFLNYSVPQVVVLEMNPFSVDNFETMRKDKIGIVFQHFDGIPDRWKRFLAVRQVADFEDVLAGTVQLLRNTSMYSRWQKNKTVSGGYDEYGSKKEWAVHYDTNFDAVKIVQQTKEYMPDENAECMNQRNREALHEILQLSEEYGFEVWVYNAPVIAFNESYANALSYVYSLKGDYPTLRYIDDSMLYLNEIGIEKTDFYDGGHLNPNGMQKVTVWMMDKIATRFNTEADTSNLVRYYSTKVKLLENESFCYEIDTYADALYQFNYTDSEGNEVRTEWSEQNYFVGTDILPKNINVDIKPLEAKDNNEIISYKFLPYTLQGYTVSISTEGLVEITNNSNFADDLEFAWYLIYGTGTDKEIIERHMYEPKNKISLELQESGVYTVAAFTKQADSDTKRAEYILTVNYDATTGDFVVEKQLECVTISE